MPDLSSAVTRFAAALVALFAITAGALAEEQNTVFYGGDYSVFTVARGGWQQCERFCNNDLTCQAWTFVRNGNQCRLKANFQEQARNACCVSGIKEIAQGPRPRQGAGGRERRASGKIQRVTIDIGAERELMCIEMKAFSNRRVDEACVIDRRGANQAEGLAELLRIAFSRGYECRITWDEVRRGRALITSASCQR